MGAKRSAPRGEGVTRWLLLVVLAAAGGRAVHGDEGSMAPPPTARAAKGMDRLLQQAVEGAGGGLTLAPGFRHYGRENLHLYMDGAAERYLGYRFDQLARAEVTAAGEVFVVELYHFGSSADAYGIWSTDSAGEHVGLGQRSAYGSGLLQFWRGPYFARVYHSRYQDGMRDTVLALGRSLADRIGEDGPTPDLLTALSRTGVKDDPVFFHEPAGLNNLHFVSDANLLKLSSQTDAVFADYRGRDGKAKLLIVRYPRGQASGARQAFIRGFLEAEPARGPQVAQLENGLWTGVGVPERRVLRLVFDAATQELALRLVSP